jgi:probable rRNA maturation factor
VSDARIPAIVSCAKREMPTCTPLSTLSCAGIHGARHAASPHRRSPEWKVTIDSALTRGRVPREAIRRVLVPVGPGEARAGEVRVIVVGDSHMRRLNRVFRKRNRQTDVLAFPLEDPFPFPGELRLIGEVYCNYDHARRWVRLHGGTVTAELSRLAVHGCLHLLGYDHHTPAAGRRMAEAENRYLLPAGLMKSRSEEPE